MDVHIHKHIQSYVIDPTVDTNLYASGDLLCEKLSINVGGDVFLNNIVVVDQASQDSALDVVFFDSDPSGTTFTENAALDIADADCDKISWVQNIAAADYVDFVDNSVAVVDCNDRYIRVNGGTLYIAVVCRGTPTYAAAGDIRLKFGLIRV